MKVANLPGWLEQHTNLVKQQANQFGEAAYQQAELVNIDGQGGGRNE